MSTQSVSDTEKDLAASANKRYTDMARLVRRLQGTNKVAIGALWVVTGLISAIFIYVLVFLVVQGFLYLFNPAFYGFSEGSIGRQLFNTFYILFLTQLFLFPVALAAAIYLNEYSNRGLIVTIIHFAAETLSGVPSIVLGMFGIAIFGGWVSGIWHVSGFTRLCWVCLGCCLNLPLALRLFEDALASVPRDLREASLALGATRWRTIRTVVLPSALPGLVTGVILSAGKIIGEAAALILTMGTTSPTNGYDFTKLTSFSFLNPLNPLISSDTLTIHIWYLKTSGAGTLATYGVTTAQENAISAGSATLLVLILLIINLGARSLGRYIQRRVTAA